MKMILASGSPRRKELLEMFRPENLRIIPAQGEEVPHPELSPDKLVMELSRCKAAEVAALHAEADDVVIGADTVVVLDDTVLGKPKDTADAKRMLSALSGRAHTVFTGVTVIRGDTVLSHAERTEVHFRPLSEDEIDRYIATGDPMDNTGVPIWHNDIKKYSWRGKAGGYGIQDPFGMKAICRIEGDYYNVMGLPVSRLCQMLKEIGVEL